MRVKVNLVLSAFVLAALATPCLAMDQLGTFRTVPEPALGLLLLVGGGFVAAKRLRRRK